MANTTASLIDLLKKHTEIAHILGFPLSGNTIFPLDLTVKNHNLSKIDLTNTLAFNDFIFDTIKQSGAKVGYGGYRENRVIYTRSAHFQGEEARSMHLGIDLWAPACTPVFAPLEGSVYSFANNEGFGNYGPTIILSHSIANITFYTLYGHLAKRALEGLKKGSKVRKGDIIGEIGNFPENGDWPPHLHFQLITDMMGMEGDFPGVCKPSEHEKYCAVCPDPNLILRIR